MRRRFALAAAILAFCSCLSYGQAPAAPPDPLKRALEGRTVLVKFDMPASEEGVDVVIAKKDAMIDQTKLDRIVAQNGIAISRGAKAHITGIHYMKNGLSIEFDGGGSPSQEWVVSGMVLSEPAATAKSSRELDLERSMATESNTSNLWNLRSELDYERQRRQRQDERNLQAFQEAVRLRDRYISENRKSWGSRVNIIFRNNKESLSLKDLSTAMAKYVELLPRETPPKSGP
jgi:hypothetical protein